MIEIQIVYPCTIFVLETQYFFFLFIALYQITVILEVYICRKTTKQTKNGKKRKKEGEKEGYKAGLEPGTFGCMQPSFTTTPLRLNT